VVGCYFSFWKKEKEVMLDRAIKIATEAHMGIRDKGGKFYILHPLRIMMRLRTDDEELMSIAVLHDVVEDSGWSIENLRAEGFSERVLDALELLTHGDGVSYDEYIDRMRYNIDALRVKREDIRDNSDITRLKGIRQKDFARLEKYGRAYIRIQGFLQKFGF
jgi:(p)ppGpp synthase/HD superfamily hydrolase